MIDYKLQVGKTYRYEDGVWEAIVKIKQLASFNLYYCEIISFENRRYKKAILPNKDFLWHSSIGRWALIDYDEDMYDKLFTILLT